MPLYLAYSVSMKRNHARTTFLFNPSQTTCLLITFSSHLLPSSRRTTAVGPLSIRAAIWVDFAWDDDFFLYFFPALLYTHNEQIKSNIYSYSVFFLSISRHSLGLFKIRSEHASYMHGYHWTSCSMARQKTVSCLRVRLSTVIQTHKLICILVLLDKNEVSSTQIMSMTRLFSKMPIKKIVISCFTVQFIH